MPIRRRKTKEGKVRNATISTVDGINFKSKLEAYCYKRLKEEHIQVDYEKYIFVLQPAFECKSESIEPNKRTKKFEKATKKIRPITYTPDFVSIEGNWIIECKGFPNDLFPLKWKIFKWYLTQQNINTILFLPRNMKQVDEVIELIKNSENR